MGRLYPRRTALSQSLDPGPHRNIERTYNHGRPSDILQSDGTHAWHAWFRRHIETAVGSDHRRLCRDRNKDHAQTISHIPQFKKRVIPVSIKKN